jgi:hypothetical protein
VPQQENCERSAPVRRGGVGRGQPNVRSSPDSRRTAALPRTAGLGQKRSSGRDCCSLLAHAQSDDAGCSSAMHAVALQNRATAVLTDGRDQGFVGVSGKAVAGRVEGAQVDRASRAGRSGLTLRARGAGRSCFALRAGRPCFAFRSGGSRGPCFATLAFDPLGSCRTLSARLALRSSRSGRSARSLRAGPTLRPGRSLRSGRTGGTLLPRTCDQQQKRQENSEQLCRAHGNPLRTDLQDARHFFDRISHSLASVPCSAT